MAKTQDKKRKQELGIFYTPSEVVYFIFEILNLWKENKPNRWKIKEGKPKYPSVIDPAVGEGGFLKVAIEKNFTKPDWIFGLDIDENAVKKWKEINLLKEFGGIDKDLEAHFFHQNGLEKIKWGQHKDKYKYKLKQVDINNQQFDTVVGNPPYGGVGLGETELTDDLITQLAKFEILPKITKDSLSVANTQTDLFGSDKSYSLKSDAKQRIKSFPIEILFLERFIQLSKPGGWIAIVIPDGILTNSNSGYVREYVSNKAKVEAVISLPRNTFKNAGTNAKTSILFLRKLKVNEKPEKDYPVFLASLGNINSNNFQKIIKAYQKLYNIKEKNMDKSQLVQITKDQVGREAVMLRADKTLKQLMEEKPSSRWNSEYWHPKYDELLKAVRKWPTVLLDDYREQIISGFRSGGVTFAQLGFPYLQVRNIMDTGVDLFNVDIIPANSPAKQVNKRVQYGDILLNRSGEGSVGRMVVFLGNEEAYVGGHVYRFAVKKISPIYLTVFLKTSFGKNQIHRFESGVSGKTEIDLEEILHIEVPIIKEIVNSVEKIYLEMSSYHDKAMKGKKSGNKTEYETNLKIAENMLKDLIIKTEEVIRGERDDVN